MFVLFFQSLLWRCFTPGSTDLFRNENLLKLTFCCKADTIALQLQYYTKRDNSGKTPHMKCLKWNIIGSYNKIHFQKAMRRSNIESECTTGECELRRWWIVSREYILGRHSLPRLQNTTDASLFFLTNGVSTPFRLQVQWIVHQLLTHLSFNVQECQRHIATLENRELKWMATESHLLSQ